MKSSSQLQIPRYPLFAGLLFGIAFGFLLQKGGVAKYHVLVGQLLLRDWTVVKIMTSAVVVGMVGIYAMKAAGMVELHIKKTKLAANSLGGILFGMGFGLSAYCPGTNLAALGQGNWDALAVVAGLVVGSYLFAECSRWLKDNVEKWGDRGKLTLLDVIPGSPKLIIPGLAILMVAILFLIEKMSVR